MHRPKSCHVRTAVLFTSHLYRQKRRGGFHWICDSLMALGWNVRFVTVDFSTLSVVRGDRRTRHGELPPPNKLIRLGDQLEVFVFKTWLHPVGGKGLKGRILNRLTAGYPGNDARRRLPALVTDSDLVIVESNSALFLVPDIVTLTKGPVIYRVSDNLTAMRPVPSLLDAERVAAGLVTCISVASEVLARKFVGLGNVRHDPMGIDKASFDKAVESPYPADGRCTVVCSGTSGLDALAFEAAARACPEMRFVLIGETSAHISGANIVATGELPFDAVVPYVKHADIGFAPYLARPGFEYQAEHSNRLLQYVYCGLPSVVPSALCSAAKPHFFGYDPSRPESAGDAVRNAGGFDRSRVPRDSVITWQELGSRLAAVANAAHLLAESQDAA